MGPTPEKGISDSLDNPMIDGEGSSKGLNSLKRCPTEHLSQRFLQSFSYRFGGIAVQQCLARAPESQAESGPLDIGIRPRIRSLD